MLCRWNIVLREEEQKIIIVKMKEEHVEIHFCNDGEEEKSYICSYSGKFVVSTSDVIRINQKEVGF